MYCNRNERPGQQRKTWRDGVSGSWRHKPQLLVPAVFISVQLALEIVMDDVKDRMLWKKKKNLK